MQCFGLGSVQFALAEVFCANILQEARGVNVNVMNLLGDAVGVLTSELGPATVTPWRPRTTSAVRVLIQAKAQRTRTASTAPS